MRKTATILIVSLASLFLHSTRANAFSDDLELRSRIGYHIGATAPLNMPATVRSVDAYHLTASFLLGLDVMKPVSEKFGLQTGLRLENKGMDGEISTKAYRMEMRTKDSYTAGVYTGQIRQKVREWMLTLPLQMTYKLSRQIQLKGGPYASLLIDKEFSGIAFNGYLRQDGPTGPKVLMGNKEGEWATYDFSEHMRNLQMGIAIGAYWQVHRRLGVSIDVNWGLTGILKSDFKTVEQTLYPIYGTIGIFYRLR